MREGKEKNILIAILFVVELLLVLLCILFATDTISLKSKEIDNNQENEPKDNSNEVINNKTDDNDSNFENETVIENKKWVVYQQCGEVLYYNPITNKVCDKGESNCYGWYVISKDTDNDSQLEVILNKNLGDTVALNENNNLDEEPITALNYLKSQTSNWKVTARMLTIDDVASILNITEKNGDGNIGVVEVPKCLYSNGDSREYWDGGYWLADYTKGKPVFVIDCSRGLISAGNQFIKSNPTNSTTWGVRPVININKSVLQ